MANAAGTTFTVTNPRADISADEIRARFDYDPETGFLSTKNGRRIGWLHPKVGYRYISIGRVGYKEHRLAWLHFYGEWPKGQIDHIDRDKQNNSIENLRDVSGSVNQRNTKLNAANTTGFRGVILHKPSGRYVAQMRAPGKRRHIGYFDTAEAASEAYLRAAASALAV